ncbi:MAG TPA: hypothetical protein VE978_02425 [Chitinophagales bacterium]|nr:hypothetical protein [Chitinophagales bacterium]
MKNFLTIVFIFTITQVKSQAPTWEWARSPTTGSGILSLGEGWSNAADANGNNYLVGFFRDTLIFGTATLTNLGGGFTAYVSKYNSSGNELWAKQVNGYSWGNNVATDASGNVYMAGSFQADSILIDTIVLHNIGWYDIFISKYDPLGNILWAKNFTGRLSGIATDVLGNVYVTGYFDNTSIALDSFILTNTDSTTSSSDFFLVKFDLNGNVIWARSGI